MLKKIWNWLVYSSEDANKISLFIKGVIGFVPSIVVFLNMIHITVSADILVALLQQIIVIITATGTLFGALVGGYGLVRKLINTLKGNNDVLNNS